LGVFRHRVVSFVEDETKLTLYGIQQYFLKLPEPQNAENG
jgi:hypothetical protein